MVKVFLVDDEIVIREGIRTSFPWEETEYVLVGEAPDGEMALPMIRDTQPDILVTDIRMPFMDGMALCAAVRSQMPWIGIIILSGYDEFEYARKGIQLGVREYMLKPVTAEELKQALDRVSESIRKEQRERGSRKSGSDQRFVTEKMLGSLYSEDQRDGDARAVVEQMRAMGVSIAAPRYAVIDAAFEPVETGYAELAELAEGSGGIVHVSPCRTGGRVLVLGDNDEDAEERAYAFGASIATELERIGCGSIRIGIGEIVEGPERIYRSLQSARHIRHVLTDQAEQAPRIVGVREFSEGNGERSAAVMTARAKLYLAEHYQNGSLMLQDAAAAVGMSNSRFSTVFAQECGKTFTEYLTGLRLEKAKELLRSTDRRSSEIAFEVGYNDSHYFSYLFKKNVGMTPGEYRSAKPDGGAKEK
ncbi:MAG: response regulator [Clostridia bacterium]|nr:response regulator [Clostridia bacterium]